MSKICTRDYSKNSLLAVKKVDGTNRCTLCGKPAVCHGKPVHLRALWAAINDSGISSQAIMSHMTGYGREGARMWPPSDRDDRGRCIRLLELIPEWIPRLREMVLYDNVQKDDGITINSSGIHADKNSWAKQIPLIMQEGKL